MSSTSESSGERLQGDDERVEGAVVVRPDTFELVELLRVAQFPEERIEHRKAVFNRHRHFVWKEKLSEFC